MTRLLRWRNLQVAATQKTQNMTVYTQTADGRSGDRVVVTVEH